VRKQRCDKNIWTKKEDDKEYNIMGSFIICIHNINQEVDEACSTNAGDELRIQSIDLETSKKKKKKSVGD
jgi:hypothetical protein